ncbi:MAG: GntR family transcriptional regulator [Candidatus Sumerlaeota bacterium]
MMAGTVPLYSSKRDMVYGALREEILSGHIEMGARLKLSDLAKRFNISAIPVREALSQLESEGLVEIRPHAGARVTSVDADTVSEIFEIMEALEVIAARRAVGRLTDEDLELLESIVNEMDHAGSDMDAWSRANWLLHEEVCRAAGSQILAGLLSQVMDHWQRLSSNYLGEAVLERHASAQQDHRRILKALQAGDADKAEKEIRRHNRSARKAYEAILKDKEKAE